ncbi:MAG: SpoIIE family protein phosphatase [Pseudomonadota bacterium]|nr:SpoIIE family protein phosphatase [Pseudomonadota bacterium]
MRLLAVSRKLSAPMELESVLSLVIDAGREVLGAERGTILLYDASRRELYAKVATGHEHIRVTIDSGIAGACARTRKTVNVEDVDSDPRFNPQIDRTTGFRTRCLVSVPLVGLDEELVGVMQLLNPARGYFDQGDENIAEVLASHAAVAIQRERLLAERIVRLKMERDLEAARVIQEGVLPRLLPIPAGYDVAAFSRPAEQTGGDLYDVIRLGPSPSSPIAFLLADASGHGIGPALSVVQVRAMLRMGLRLGASLEDLVRQIDAQLLQDLGDDQFVTAFFGCLDPVGHELVYHAAGQGPLLHFHAADGRAEWRGASALPLGVAEVEVMAPSLTMHLEPGDFIVLLTDGIYECADPSGAVYGEERVVDLIVRHRTLDARSVLGALLRAVDSFAAGAPQADDLTAIIIQRRAADH